jgi:fumarate hydratase class II
MPKLPNSKRSKIGRTHLMDATPQQLVKSQCKLWFEGGKKTLTYQK